MNKFDVIGFGALNVDKLYEVEEIVRPGGESFAKSLTSSPGGSAANTLVGLARLGLRTGFIGKVAGDTEGELLLNDFKNEGVDHRGVVVSEEGSSGVCIGQVDKNGERSLFIYPGVNDKLDFEEIDIDYVNSEYLHLTSFVCLLGTKSYEAQKKLIEKMVGKSIITFDPGQLYVNRGLDDLKPVINRSHVLFLNENEAKQLSGEVDVHLGAKRLTEKNRGIVAVKLGAKGCYVTNGGDSYSIESYPANVVDTTGAGDAFNAGFIFGLRKGKDMYECGKLGNFVASKCIEKIGGRTGLPKYSELRI